MSVPCGLVDAYRTCFTTDGTQKCISISKQHKLHTDKVKTHRHSYVQLFRMKKAPMTWCKTAAWTYFKKAENTAHLLSIPNGEIKREERAYPEIHQGN